MKTGKLALAAIFVVVAVLPVCAEKKKEAPQSAIEPQSTAEVVAYVEDVAITKQELDDILAGRLMRIRQQEYDLRKGTLDQMVAQRLLENEAESRGVSMADLMRTEVEEKAPKATDQEITQYYETYKTRIRGLQGKTREQAGPDVARILNQQRMAQRRYQFVQEIRAKSDVRVTLEPPRVEVMVPAGEPAKGPHDAPVTIVEFFDYQCGYCRNAESTVGRLMAEYGDRIRIVYRDYPMNFHQRALPASLAARCAGDQDKYWEYHENLMKVDWGKLEDEDLKKRAQDLELDMAAFSACFDSNRHRETVQASFQDGNSLGVTGTPTFFVNGRMIVGAKPYNEFKSVIDEELERAAADQKEDRIGG